MFTMPEGYAGGCMGIMCGWERIYVDMRLEVVVEGLSGFLVLEMWLGLRDGRERRRRLEQ